MQQKKHLFRAVPSKEVVEDILRELGFSAGLKDLRWFSAEELTLETQETWLPILEPYYLPCKARRFFEGKGELDGVRTVTLIKHILSCHDYYLKVQERLYKEKKQTLYQIQPTDPFRDLSGVDMVVSFL